MPLFSRSTTLSVAAVLGSVLAARVAVPAGAVKPGDTPHYTWRAPLVNGMGVTSLEDLRGKPVLFDFWGTR